MGLYAKCPGFKSRHRHWIFLHSTLYSEYNKVEVLDGGLNIFDQNKRNGQTKSRMEINGVIN